MNGEELFYQRGGGSKKAFSMVVEAEKALKGQFSAFEETAFLNQQKVLCAFEANEIAIRHFAPSTGYGYGDEGRDMLERLFANVFCAEDALVRPQIVSGTHAIALSLQGILHTGDIMVSGTGKPYDTMEQVIGISGEAPGSLKNMGVEYRQVELLNGALDIPAILAHTKDATVLFLQRSRGYEWREALLLTQMKQCIAQVKAQNPACVVVVDNCYGEFTEVFEPLEMGADIIAGSLIKNPGGGIAPTGGYIAGKSALVDEIAQRLTCPGLGKEVGSYAQSYAPFYQGFFLAPHVVCQSLKGATLFSKVFEMLGYETLPASTAHRGDIIQSVRLQSEEQLIALCRAIQKASPVDSHVTPYPWDMPGYQHQVIMAAGAFVEGASLELSADAPIKKPYTAYIQGGLTYEHCKLAVLRVLSSLID
ncbi:methionine gamma-lyase family protein [Clostridia bacterium OttesenSCG-928-F22]|nr:methionine gamma-lyase family protein [Clostridia bacterium OttesenSCG-928-F22]